LKDAANTDDPYVKNCLEKIPEHTLNFILQSQAEADNADWTQV